MSMQSFLSERDPLQAPRATANRPSTELPPTLFGQSQCTVLKGSVIAESDQDLAKLFARYQTGNARPNVVPPKTRTPEPPAQLVSERTEHGAATEGAVNGNMMELEHFPKARLVVRHPARRTQTPLIPSADISPLMRAPSVASGGFGRAASVSSHAPSLGFEGTAVPPYPGPPQNLSYPAAMPNHPMDAMSPMDSRTALNDPSFMHLTQSQSSFDVSRLGSLRYAQLGNGGYASSCLPQNLADPFGMQYSGRYGPQMEAMAPGFGYEVPPMQHPVMHAQTMSLFPGGTGSRCPMPHQPYGMMIPTPRFVTGGNKQQHSGGGPIELPATRSAQGRAQARQTSQELLNLGFEKEDQSVLEFMDQLLYPDTQKKGIKPKKAPKKGKGQGNGVTKARAPRKAATNKKAQTANKKSASKPKAKSAEVASLKREQASTVEHKPAAAYPLEAGTSDASCLLWAPPLTDMKWPEYELENLPCESMRSSERDDVSEVYRFLEDAGLDALPHEDELIPPTCPILPPPSLMSPSTPEDILELGFCCLGSTVATAADLQAVMRSWLHVASQGPRWNPCLELWNGIDHVKVFSEEFRGHERITTCLMQCMDRFHSIGTNALGQELWEGNHLAFFNKAAPTEMAQGKLRKDQTTSLNSKRKRKGAAATRPSQKSNT